MSEATLDLAPFEPAHAALLAEWLARPHVARWHPDPADRIAWALNPSAGGAQALILLGARPIGHLRWQTVSRETLDALGLDEIPGKTQVTPCRFSACRGRTLETASPRCVVS